MIADRAISMKLDDTVNFTCIEELSRLIMGEEMLFHFVQSAAGVFPPRRQCHLKKLA